MFRTQQNAFDDAVGRQSCQAQLMEIYQLTFNTAKATDENLTSENWEYILVGLGISSIHLRQILKSIQDVCDRVSAEETG